jgi:hypothetical protein
VRWPTCGGTRDAAPGGVTVARDAHDRHHDEGLIDTRDRPFDDPYQRCRHAELRAGFQPDLAGCREPRRGRTDRRSGSRGCSPGLPDESTNSSHRAQPPISPSRPPTPAALSTATSTTLRREVPHIAWAGLPVRSVKRATRKRNATRENTLRWGRHTVGTSISSVQRQAWNARKTSLTLARDGHCPSVAQAATSARLLLQELVGPEEQCGGAETGPARRLAFRRTGSLRLCRRGTASRWSTATVRTRVPNGHGGQLWIRVRDPEAPGASTRPSLHTPAGAIGHVLPLRAAADGKQKPELTRVEPVRPSAFGMRTRGDPSAALLLVLRSISAVGVVVLC